MDREKHFYVTHSDYCRDADVLNASSMSDDNVFPLKTFAFSFNCRSLSFVNLDEHESSVYMTHVYVLVKIIAQILMDNKL